MEKQQKKEMEKQMEELKKEMEKKMDKQKKELNEKIDNLKNNYDRLKRGFIFKGFLDYILLVFNIQIDLKYEDKIKLLKENTKKNEIDYPDIYFIVKSMKNLYSNTTNISHEKPTFEEIRKIILAQFHENEEDEIFLSNFFIKLKPEEHIQMIINKNNALTLILTSREVSKKERELEACKIISEINCLLSADKKKEIIKKIKEIINDYYSYH